MKDSLKSTKTTVIWCIVIGVLLVGLAVYVAFSGDGSGFLTPATPTPTKPAPTQPAVKTEGDTTRSVLILHADTEGRSIRVYEPSEDAVFSLYYTGATDIKNRFGQVIAGSQIKDGTIAEISYDRDAERVYRISLSSDYWEYKDVTGLNPEPAKGMLTINGTNYRCTAGTVVLSNGELIPMEELQDVDVVNIRGIEDRVFVIELVQGHGQLYLMNETEFIGGSLYVDNVFATQIAAGTSMLVREGTYEIAVSFGELHGEETITMNRNGTVIFDCAPYGTVETKKGKATFYLTPEGAGLYIDGSYHPFTEDILLDYGEHTVEVAFGGYTTWTGKITVSSPETTLTVALVETVKITPTPTPDPLRPTTGPTPATDPLQPDTSPTPTGTTGENPPDSTSETGEDNPDEGNPDEENPDEGDPEEEDPNAPSQEGVPAGSVKIQIVWYPSSVVRIDSVYAGMTDAGGVLETVTTAGTHIIELVRTVIDGSTLPASYTVEVDKSTPILIFPHGN